MAKSNKSRPETKKAALEREYKRARKNYVERIRYYSNKTGLDLKSLIPKRPKRITEASIRRLKSQTGKEILKKAKKTKKLKAKEELEKKSPTMKKSSGNKESYVPQKSSIILDNCFELLNEMYDMIRGTKDLSRPIFEKHHDELLSYLNHEIDKYGHDVYAQILENIGEPFLKAFETLAYTYDDYRFYALLNELNTMVYGANLSMSDSLELAQIADAQQSFVEYG